MKKHCVYEKEKDSIRKVSRNVCQFQISRNESILLPPYLLFIRQSGRIFNSFVVVLERYTTFEIQVRQIRKRISGQRNRCNQDPISTKNFRIEVARQTSITILSGKRPRKVGEKSFNRCTVSTKPGKLLMDRSPVWNNFFFPSSFFFLFSND